LQYAENQYAGISERTIDATTRTELQSARKPAEKRMAMDIFGLG
jgi:hypothetical protein